MVAGEVGRAIAAFHRLGRGGKSGLPRITCQVTPGGREPTESATENRPPKSLPGNGLWPVRVKRCGKSAPRQWQHRRLGKPHVEQGQIGKQPRSQGQGSVDSYALPGRPLEALGDGGPQRNDCPRQNPAYRPTSFFVQGPR